MGRDSVILNGGRAGRKETGLNKVVICGVDTSTLPTLGQGEMRQLLAEAKAGDKAARDKLVTGNLRLVLSVIQRFSNRAEQADDLFQVGCIGLMKAIDNFDIAQNVRFSTYAVPMIIGEIRRFLRDYTALRVSRSLRDTAGKAMQVKKRLTDELNREPTVGEIAKAMDLPEADVVYALDAVVDPVSLFEPVFHEDGDALYVIDQIRDESAGEGKWLDSIALEEGIGHLNEREQRIVKLRYFQMKTQMEVSREIGISQAQVSRLEKGALERLKKYI